MTEAPTEAPSATPTTTESPSALGSCPGGTLIDFEGVDAIILEDTLPTLYDIGSGVQVGFFSTASGASFVSNVSEVGNFSLAPTTHTSGGVFFSAADASFLSIQVNFAEFMCEISFGVAVGVSEPVDFAVQVQAGVSGVGTPVVAFPQPAAPGEFDRASGLVHLPNNGTAINLLSVSSAVDDDGFRTIILDNLCFVPCE